MIIRLPGHPACSGLFSSSPCKAAMYKNQKRFWRDSHFKMKAKPTIPFHGSPELCREVAAQYQPDERARDPSQDPASDWPCGTAGSTKKFQLLQAGRKVVLYQLDQHPTLQ